MGCLVGILAFLMFVFVMYIPVKMNEAGVPFPLVIGFVLLELFVICGLLALPDANETPRRNVPQNDESQGDASQEDASGGNPASGTAFATSSREKEIGSLVNKGDTTASDCYGLRSGIFDIDDFD